MFIHIITKFDILIIRGVIFLKKLIWLIIFFLICTTKVYATNDVNVIKNAKSGVLMDASTGILLYEKDKDKKVAVASMTKMITQILILENIESGNLSCALAKR